MLDSGAGGAGGGEARLRPPLQPRPSHTTRQVIQPRDAVTYDNVHTIPSGYYGQARRCERCVTPCRWTSYYNDNVCYTDKTHGPTADSQWVIGHCLPDGPNNARLLAGQRRSMLYQQGTPGSCQRQQTTPNSSTSNVEISS